jgi:excisionase family DNA binding protein
MRPIISPRELAEAIGVSESSLKRWADDGQIQVSRTGGGHRRIAIGEAIRFVRAIRAPLVKPELLGLRDLSSQAAEILAPELPAERLFGYLRDGRAREARGLVLALYLQGQGVADIADGPIRIAMERLGELWKHDQAGIYLEHRATDICIQAVEQLRLLVEPQQFHAVALGGAPP